MDGVVLWGSAEREMEEEVKERSPGGGVRPFVLLRYGDDPETEPPDLRACRHRDRAG